MMQRLFLRWTSCLAVCTFIMFSSGLVWLLSARRHLPESQPSFAISFGKGRLGNQLSSYATLLSFGKDYGLIPLVTLEQAQVLYTYFNVPKLNIMEEVLPDWSWYRWRDLSSPVDPRLQNLDYSVLERQPSLYTGHTLDVGRYPNEMATFKKYLPELRVRLRFRKAFQDWAEQQLIKAKEQYFNLKVNKGQGGEGSKALNVTFVGVHIRRGDYGHHLQKLYGLDLLNATYFHQAMQFYRDRYQHPLFLLVSDDLSWAQEEIGSDLGDVFFSGNREVTKQQDPETLVTGQDIGKDLALLSMSNHSILTYGTFGMWGALLAGGRAVLPEGYDAMKEVQEIKKADLPDWTFL